MANLLTRIGFIDETSVKTNMAKTTGWAPRGQRLIDHAPFGSWQTQTFIAALRHDRLDAPWVIDGPINRDLFDLYIETQLAPTLQPGDVIILDNLSVHKSPKAAQILKDIGCWFLPLPPYSPDLNPIEMAFAKLKALLRKAAARTYDDLWKAVGTVCDIFTDDECLNYFIAAGYKPDWEGLSLSLRPLQHLDVASDRRGGAHSGLEGGMWLGSVSQRRRQASVGLIRRDARQCRDRWPARGRHRCRGAGRTPFADGGGGSSERRTRRGSVGCASGESRETPLSPTA